MINTSTVKIVGDVSGFNRAMDTAENKTQSFDKVVGKLKTAAITMGAAMLASAGVSGIGAMISRSMQLRDEQAKLGDRMGITNQQVAAFTLHADLAGVGADGFEKALQKMTTRLQEAAEKGGPTADAVKQLGLNIFELASKRPDEAFFAISDAMNSMTDSNKRLNVITDIFGEKQAGIVNMLAEGRDGFDAAARKATEFGTAISRVDAAKLEAANDSFTLMQASVDGLATRMGVRLSPMLQQMAENFARNTTAMAKFFGFRTEEEQLNYLLEQRAEIIARIEKIQKTTNDTLKIAHLRKSADALRSEINVILDKQQAEASAFIASDKIRIAEEAATAKRLENNALEIAASKNKKAAIDAELQSMRDQSVAEKALHEEVMVEFNERAINDQLLIDQRVNGKINELNNIRQINELEVAAAREKAGYIMEIEEQQYRDQIARGESAFSTMLGNVSSHNKTFFKIQKLYRLSKLAMEAPAAIADSYAWGASWGGPPAGTAMAGIAAAAMGAYAGQLAGASFGGGGIATAAAGGSSNPVTAPISPGAISVTQPEQRSGSITIHINGPTNEQFVVDTVIPMIKDGLDNRDLILIRNGQRQYDELMA